jgi:hypothetical protein
LTADAEFRGSTDIQTYAECGLLVSRPAYQVRHMRVRLIAYTLHPTAIGYSVAYAVTFCDLCDTVIWFQKAALGVADVT